MRYAQITPFEICNGKGAGVSLFVQGCRFCCKGCFNSEAWDFNGGKEWTQETEDKFFELIDTPYIKRVAILGGEPLHPLNIDTVINIAKKTKEIYPNKQVYIWTGFLFDNIINKDILKYADVIIDGKYVDELKDLTLKWRGSSNQKIWEKDSNGRWCCDDKKK